MAVYFRIRWQIMHLKFLYYRSMTSLDSIGISYPINLERIDRMIVNNPRFLI
jgi:hypothetical protein